LKPLRKRVRFVESFHPPGGGNKFTGDHKDPTGGLRTKEGFTGFKGPVRTRKELRASVKRVGAVQVFCPKASRTEDLEYRLSRVFDNVSFCQSPYSGQRILQFQVATAYKTKANKVCLVDLGETDGSKPGGCLDWFEKSKADDVHY
jgi:hypothetical protein